MAGVNWLDISLSLQLQVNLHILQLVVMERVEPLTVVVLGVKPDLGQWRLYQPKWSE